MESTEGLPPLHERTLLSVLRRNMQVRPTRPALSDSNTSLTHAQLWERVCRCAGGLRALGIREGDVVLLMLDNSVENFVVYASISFLGATSVPTNTAYKGSILKHVIEDSACTAAIIEAPYFGAVVGAVGGGAPRLIVRTTGIEAEFASADGRPWCSLNAAMDAEPCKPVEVGPQHAISIMYTSGTTGPSKGALTSQAGAYSICYPPDIIGPTDDNDVMLVVAPMFHALGLFGGAYGALIAGACAHIESQFSASRFWDQVAAVGATRTALVGTMVAFLMNQPARDHDDAHSLERVFVTPRTTAIRAFVERFGVATSTSFGSTESGVVIHNMSDDPSLLGSIGWVRNGFQVRLVDANDMPVRVGDPGECIVRSEEPWVISPAYAGRPAATATAWRNGWFHTGDILRQDGDGLFYFVDRLKDSIRRRGENISSVEVEREVLTHPGVMECAAVGVGDPRVDQEVKIEIILKTDADLTETELIHYLIDRMPYYAVPRYVSIVSDLPRTPTGKIRKRDLRHLESGTWDREERGIKVGRLPNRVL